MVFLETARGVVGWWGGAGQKGMFGQVFFLSGWNSLPNSEGFGTATGVSRLINADKISKQMNGGELLLARR